LSKEASIKTIMSDRMLAFYHIQAVPVWVSLFLVVLWFTQEIAAVSSLISTGNNHQDMEPMMHMVLEQVEHLEVAFQEEDARIEDFEKQVQKLQWLKGKVSELETKLVSF
jgi:hypothetical protein